jgi:hypothetical protein
MKTIKNLLLVLGFGLLSATATAQNPETGALMTDPNVGCAYGYGQYGYMNCGGSGGSSGSARPQPPKVINRYGAVAWNSATNNFSSAKNESSKSQANSVALAGCGVGCKIMNSYANSCIAVAWGAKKVGSTTITESNPNLQIAESNALAKCNRSKAQNCRIVLSECSKYN